MSIGEFDLINRFFNKPRQAGQSSGIQLGIGDDCALLAPSPGMTLAVSTDMLVAGRHFLSTITPQRLGHKSLAVNLSDLAAMGAKPMAFTLSLALPEASESWAEDFAQGLFALADAHHCPLIGGDTTAGPLCISITVFGEIPFAQALKRSGACVDDGIYISHPAQGGIGDARLMLEALRGQARLSGDDFGLALERMERPTPRIELGMALRDMATAAIDLSDGLLGDLSHILQASGVGASIDADSIARSPLLQKQPEALQRLCTLAGGDDYELVFTAPAHRHEQVMAAAYQSHVSVTRIGKIDKAPGIRIYDAQGHELANRYQSFDHFKS